MKIIVTFYRHDLGVKQCYFYNEPLAREFCMKLRNLGFDMMSFEIKEDLE